MAEPNVTPQQALKKAQHDLAVALRGALQALESPGATPGLMGVAMQALQSAQVAWNAAVSRIPLEVMTDGITIQPETDSAEETILRPNCNDDELPFVEVADISRSTNARKWADAFLAINKNQAVDRETLVGWFADAIETGRSAGLFQARATD